MIHELREITQTSVLSLYYELSNVSQKTCILDYRYY